MKETDTVNDNMIYLTFYLVDLCIDAPEDIATPVLERGTVVSLYSCRIRNCLLLMSQHQDRTEKIKTRLKSRLKILPMDPF